MNFNKDLFFENLSGLNIPVDEGQISLLDSFAEMVIEKNKVMNLTAITDPDSFAIKHFADSISVSALPEYKAAKKIMDVGTGAGFPGVPLLIMNPEIELTMLDSTAKRLAFVSDSIAALGLNAEIKHARAEELGKDTDYREKYDAAVSRAVASLNVLSEYCLPFVKVGGYFFAMKSSKADEEIAQAKDAISLLGGKIEKVSTFRLSDDAERNIVVIKKIKPTPPKYPRVSAQIAKKSL